MLVPWDMVLFFNIAGYLLTICLFFKILLIIFDNFVSDVGIILGICEGFWCVLLLGDAIQDFFRTRYHIFECITLRVPLVLP